MSVKNFFLSFALEFSAFTPIIFTSLSIKGKIFIFDIFPKILPMDRRIPFLIRYFKQIEIISPPIFSKTIEYFSYKIGKSGVLIIY
jgi:hypothetical protein